MSGIFNIKARARADSHVARDGLRGFNQLPTFGKKLTGLQFSGKRSKFVVKSSGCLTEEVTCKGCLLEPQFYGGTTKRRQVKFNQSTLGIPEYLSKSAPTLSRGKNSKRSAVFTANLPDVRKTKVALRIHRKTSDSFVQGLKTFRAHKEFRILAARRLSEELQLQQRNHIEMRGWLKKLHELSDRQKQLALALQEHLQEEKLGEDEPTGDHYKRIRRFSDLFKTTGGGLGAVSKWKTKLAVHKARPKIPPRQRFRSYIRLTLICVRLCKYSHESVESSQDEYLSIIQLTEDYVASTEDPDGLFFDPTVFRANKEQRLPADARKILQKDHLLRTDKDIDYLHLVLRSISAFSEYPNDMQKKLCRVGWYEAYEPKRAIVRQGQPPHAFYFILSGSVVVTSFDRHSGGTTFLVALHKGMSFGELAVITGKRRQATVSTATITELLCISARDFVEIFMSGGIKSVTDPDHNSFIRSIPFLKYWPIECLATNPQACMFHFFGRGQVLVRDSNHSEWIYIVKSGSLSVLKKLVEVHPRTSRRDTDTDSDDDSSLGPHARSFGTWDFRIKKKKRLESTGEKEVFKNNIEMEKRLEQTLPGFYNATDRLGLIDYDEIISDHKSRVLQTNRRASVMPDALPKITIQTADSTPADTPVKEGEDGDQKGDEAIKLPKIRKTSKGAYLATTKNSNKKSSRKEAIQEELFRKQLEYDKKALDDKKVGRKTITDELDNKMIKDFTLTEKDIRPMFVQVQILERGQYFGLTKTVFPEQAESFSVVSNGAECIMISKKFFLERANEQTMYHLRQVETLLPPEEELQANLQDFVDWKAHRAKVYNRLVKNKHSRVERHHQFPPQYGGQYCFRTGPTVRID